MLKKAMFLASVALASLVLSPRAAHAISISVLPQSSGTTVGSTFAVDVVASGLGEGVAPSLGVYDLNFAYDASLLSFANIAFGSGLDVENLGLNFQQGTFGAPGFGNIFELSLNSVAALNQLQHDAFTLFTLTFNATAMGTSFLDLSINELGDAEGNALPASVNGATVAVPESTPLSPAAWLLLSGVAFLIKPLRDWRSARRARMAGATLWAR